MTCQYLRAKINMKRWINKKIRKLRTVSIYSPVKDDAKRALCLIRRRGFEPRTIIDIGAFKGKFSRWAKREFPGAKAVMFEANAEWEADLRAMQERLGNGVQYRIGLLGDQPRESVRFFRGGTGSSIYKEMTSVQMEEVDLPMSTLDGEFEALGLTGPCLLKIDVQGAEIDVLSGGLKTLESVEFVLSECSVLEYNKGGAQLAQMIAWMDEHGFVLYDICQIMRLPDQSLNQMDVVFVRKDSAYRRSGELF